MSEIQFKDFIKTLQEGKFIDDIEIIAEVENDEETEYEDSPWTVEELCEFLQDLDDEDLQEVGDIIYTTIMYNDETDEVEDFDYDDYDYDMKEAQQYAQCNDDFDKGCDWCGSKADLKDGKCPKCGSTVTMTDTCAGEEAIEETKFFDTKKRELLRKQKQNVALRKRKAKLLAKYYKKNKARIQRMHKIYAKKTKRNPNMVRKHKA